MPLDPFAALGIDAPTSPPPAVVQGAAPDSAPKSSGPDPFAALGVDTSQQFTPTQSTQQTAPKSAGIPQNFAAGANRTIFGVLGAPVDLVTGGINYLGRQVGAPPIQNPVGGSDWLSHEWQNVTGVNPNDVKPQTTGERAAAAAGGAVAQVPFMAAGGAAGAALAPEGSVARGVSQLVQDTNTPAVAAPVAAGAATGSVAEDVAPDNLKPYANLAGNIAGAGLAQGVASVGRGLVGGAIRQGGLAGIGPKQEVGGVQATQSQIDAASSKVAHGIGPAGQANLQTGVDTVAGDNPTTAQVAQTPGATGLEQAARVKNPEPFLQRAQEQNTARLNAVQSLAPEQAQPGAVGALFRQQLDQIDQEGQRAVQGAQAGVTQATEAHGGALPTEAYGEQIRSSLQTAQEPVTANTRALWQAVDPEGTWALPVTGARDAAQQLLGEVSPTAQMDAQESALLQRAANLPDVARFSDLGDMRADINAATRRLSGTPGYEPNVRRLTILKGSLDQSIEDAVNGKAQQEAQAVSTGQLSPEQTMQGRFAAKVSGWYADRGAQAAAGGDNPARAGGYAGGGSSAVPGVAGARGQAGRAAGGPPGNPGLAPEVPNLTQANSDAYSSAVAATRAEKQQFGQGGVGQVLRPGKQGADYAVQDGNVPRQIFTRGPTEPAEVERFINAVGGPAQASRIGEETLTNELRETGIFKPDGTVDADKFAKWQARRQPTISQFPGLAEKFANTEAAQRTLDNAVAAHQTALKDFQNSAAARFIKDDPQKALVSALGSPNPTRTFKDLSAAVRGNPDAEAGLKRTFVDYLVEKTRGATPGEGEQDMLKPTVFRNWLRQNSGPIKELFGGQGLQTLDMVAAAIRRSQMPAAATVGSNTVDKAMGAIKHGMATPAGHGSLLGVLMLAGEHLGEHVHGGLGAIGGALAMPALGHLASTMRQAGIKTQQDLLAQLMLHPDLAREAVARVNGKVTTTQLARFNRALQATLVTNAAQPQEQKQ